MRKKVDSRIVISTNGVTHILLPRALRPSWFLKYFMPWLFTALYLTYKTGSAKSIYERQSEEEFLLLAIPSQSRAHVCCFIHQLCCAGTREILTLKEVLTLQFFPFTYLLRTSILLFYRYSLILIKSFRYFIRELAGQSSSVGVCQPRLCGLLGYGFG